MEYFFAPMEGVTGALFRAVHHRHFPGIGKYYMPFLSPTRDHVFTNRDLREIAPERNRDLCAVPQLLTRNAEDFRWAAQELSRMGYGEVNLNLGCPSGTVTAKGKGAGMLADLPALERFLEEIFPGLPCRVSVKTRVGVESPEEFPKLLEVFRRYPISRLIVHPRVLRDFYRHPVRPEAFAFAAEHYPGPLCYNGGLGSPEDCARLTERFPQVDALMFGRGLLADPALVRRLQGGPPACAAELRAFHDELYHTYLQAFHNDRGVVCHMKELWSYMGPRFQGADRALKRIRKAQTTRAYDSAVSELFALPLSAPSPPA